jgi:bifunctional DNase/RNase
MGSIFLGYGIEVKQVVINDIQDTVYFARLFLEMEKNGVKDILEVDARPSDCITLALMTNAPLYCSREVLGKAIHVED